MANIEIQVMITRMEELGNWSCLRFNVDKCATLSMGYRGRKLVVEGRGRQTCTIPSDRPEAFFREEYSETSIDTEGRPEWLDGYLRVPDNPPEWDSSRVTPE